MLFNDFNVCYFFIFQCPETREIIELNVGGKYFTTSVSTMTKDKDSKLAAMFDGQLPVSKDKHGRYFIDADGAVFTHILEYLRFEHLPPDDFMMRVHEYAEYFGLQSLVRRTALHSAVHEAQQLRWSRMLYSNYSEMLKGVLERINNAKYGPTVIVFAVVRFPATEKSEQCGNNHKKITESDFIAIAVSEDKNGWNLVQALLHDLAAAGIIVNDTTCNKCVFCQYPYSTCGCTKFYKIHVSRRFNIHLLN